MTSSPKTPDGDTTRRDPQQVLLPVPQAAASLPAEFGRYRIEGELGRGGMGRVLRARTSDGTQVALKVIVDPAGIDVESMLRFGREAQIGRLRHPNLVTVFDAGSLGGRPYLVMELVEGTTLDGRLRHGPLASEEVLRIGRELARGLAHLHAHGVVHRDLKPANVLIGADGSVKIADFGIAAVAQRGVERLTKTGEVLGTPAYMAPEQVRSTHGTGPCADVYSWGATLYHALSGQAPFRASTTLALLTQVLEDPPPLLPDHVDPLLSRCVQRCLEKDPAERPRDGLALVEVLAGLQTGLRTSRPARRWVLPAVVGALSLGVWTVVSLRTDPEADPRTATREDPPREDLPREGGEPPRAEVEEAAWDVSPEALRAAHAEVSRSLEAGRIDEAVAQFERATRGWVTLWPSEWSDLGERLYLAVDAPGRALWAMLHCPNTPGWDQRLNALRTHIREQRGGVATGGELGILLGELRLVADPRRASVYVAQLVQRFPNDGALLFFGGLHLAGLGEFEAGLPLLVRCETAAAPHWDPGLVTTQATFAAEARDWQTLETLALERAHELAPDPCEAWGYALRGQGRGEAAACLLERYVVERRPTDWRPYFALGQALCYAQRLEEGLPWLDEAVERAGTSSPWPRLRRAEQRFVAGDHEGCRQDLAWGDQHAPNHYSIPQTRARLALLEGDPATAIEQCERAEALRARLDPTGNPEVLYRTWADAYRAQGNPEAAAHYDALLAEWRRNEGRP